ncbi:MAG: exosortase family protein XrtF [Flavobacterium sp.]|nr:exosortase family protein XrtF [Flavobacterium sp.]
MKKYLSDYKPFLLFLAKFFAVYLVLTFAYQSYLFEFDTNKNEVDGFTKTVASQTEIVLSIFDNHSFIMKNLKEPCVNLFFHNQWVARIIEGCNALSVIILFISFVFAFTGKFGKTIVFILFGSLIIHFFNIVRIALLAMSVYYHPKSQEFLHNIVFPLFIYGVVFLLWIIWVNKFSFYASKPYKK